MNPRLTFLTLVTFLALLGGSGRATAGEYSLTVPFPIRSADFQETNGLFSTAPHQVLSPNGSGHSDFFFAPVHTGEAVFVTVVFQDDPALNLGLNWQGADNPKVLTLAGNLSEKVSGWTQRTIRIPAELSAPGGILSITGDQRAVARVRVDWLRPSESYVAVDQTQPTLILGGRSLTDRQLRGETELSQPDAWLGDVFEAGLQEESTPIGTGISFAVPLEEAPGVVALRARFQGVALGNGVSVWINDRYAGQILPEIPSLTDPGFVRLADGKLIYAGWRDASLVIRAGLLTPGENLITLLAADAGVSIRDATLQILVPVVPGTASPADLQWPAP